jgi:hypothetical protein
MIGKPRQISQNHRTTSAQLLGSSNAGRGHFARGYHNSASKRPKGSAMSGSETKCKRYRGSHPLAVVPVRTEKGVPGDGDALLLF